MVPIQSLWAPILVAAVAVFVVSSIVHMVLRYHNRDYRALPREAETLAGLRQASLTPGMYFFPHASNPKEMGSPEMLAKYQEGPVGHLTVMPSRAPAMGKHLTQWFLFCVLVSVFAACIAGAVLAPGADNRAVFHVIALASFLAYGVGRMTDSIWMGHPWSATAKQLFDGLLYALATAAAFCWLWPR